MNDPAILLYTQDFLTGCSDLIKIGRSIDPEFREKTLQSEKPNCEIIYISPITNPKNEKLLHTTYKNQRIRGEWFILSNRDINDIKGFNYGS